MAHLHGNHGGGDVVARIHRHRDLCAMTAEDVAHVRDLAFASLAQESCYLARYAEDAWAGERGGDAAETASQHVRRTCKVLDRIGWEA
jgi:hypothetical protein